MLITSLIIPMSMWNVPILLTAVTVYGPFYAVLAYLADCSPLTITLCPTL